MGVSINLPNRSDFEVRQGALLAQILADSRSDYVELAGSDPKISRNIQRLKNAIKLGYITDEEEKRLAEEMLIFLDGDRMAAFATSDNLNDITKLGLQLPKKTREVKASERR